MKKIIVPLAEGFEEIEAISIIDILRRANIEVVTLQLNDDKEVLGAHGIKVKADIKLKDLESLDYYDGIAVPGGMGGVNNLMANNKILDMIKFLSDDGKLVSAICAGPMVLERAGVLKGINATCYPGLEDELKSATIVDEIVAVDGNIITSKGPATAVVFALEIVKKLLGEEEKNKVSEGLLFPLLKI